MALWSRAALLSFPALGYFMHIQSPSSAGVTSKSHRFVVWMSTLSVENEQYFHYLGAYRLGCPEDCRRATTSTLPASRCPPTVRADVSTVQEDRDDGFAPQQPSDPLAAFKISHQDPHFLSFPSLVLLFAQVSLLAAVLRVTTIPRASLEESSKLLCGDTSLKVLLHAMFQFVVATSMANGPQALQKKSDRPVQSNRTCIRHNSMSHNVGFRTVITGGPDSDARYAVRATGNCNDLSRNKPVDALLQHGWISERDLKDRRYSTPPLSNILCCS
ncbi:hypothetical protein BKA70DRAFT_1243164 [Coprinopsis sp. MPI-PUGE-AT-0042]|nr:hypothetical protein BKA70DRAFT_1243164 [Coprinopsis sp. MPI-PUGE-AT-0042]